MPSQFTLPPDTRSVGSGNPPVDMNGVVDALTAMGATANVLNAAFAGGADPTGSADSAAAFNAALAALPTVNGIPAGTIVWPPGTYKVGTGAALSNSGPYVQVRGIGTYGTQIGYYGSGDCARAFGPIVPQLGNWGTISSGYWGTGGWSDLVIDGTNAGAGACGYHYGDAAGFRNRLTVQNFTGAGSIGVRKDNSLHWTEKDNSEYILLNNTVNMKFDVSDGPAYTSTTLVSASAGVATFTNAGGWAIPGGYGQVLQAGMLLTGSAGITTPATANVSTLSVTSVSGTTLTCAYTGTAPSGTPGTLTVTNSTNSHAYSDYRFYIQTLAAQDGVVVANGAQVYSGSLWHRGNYSNSASALTNASLRIAGTVPAGHPGALVSSNVARAQIDWKAETGQAGANHPFTVVITNPSGLFSSNGMFDFAAGTWQAASIPAGSSFQFYGTVLGDTVLQRNQFVTATSTRQATARGDDGLHVGYFHGHAASGVGQVVLQPDR